MGPVAGWPHVFGMAGVEKAREGQGRSCETVARLGIARKAARRVAMRGIAAEAPTEARRWRSITTCKVQKVENCGTRPDPREKIAYRPLVFTHRPVPTGLGPGAASPA